jgi:phosphatidylglycerol:prolipoprotein diacylglycerol transferase
MIPLALGFPDIDPIAIQLGPLAIRWYALAYIAGIVLGWVYMRGLARREPVFTTPVAVDDFVVWATLGIVLGGRLGYVLFYNFDYYSQNPLQVVYLWQGGMAFHGGFLGVVLATYLFARHHKFRFTQLADIVVMAAPIGLFFGRIANFVNGELFGRVTDVSWAVVFPGGGDLPRHPSQLYEAALEGLVLFLLLFVLDRTTRVRERPGTILGLFIVGYGLARFAVEFVRQPDAHLGTLALGLSMGQWLSMPMILAGAAIMTWALLRRT